MRLRSTGYWNNETGHRMQKAQGPMQEEEGDATKQAKHADESGIEYAQCTWPKRPSDTRPM